MAARVREVFTRTLNLRQAVRLVYSASPSLFAISALLVIIQSLVPVAVLYVTKLMIDNITLQLSLPAESRDFSEILTLILLVGGVTLIGAVVTSIALLVTEAQSQVVSDNILKRIHGKSVEVDLAYYENAQVYDSLHRAQRDAPYRPPRIVNGVLRIGQSVLTLLGLLGLLATINLGITLIVFAAALPRLLVQLWSSRVLHGWLQRRSVTERLLSYYNFIMTYSSYAKEVRLFGLGTLFVNRYDATRAVLRREKLQISARRSVFDLGAQTISVIALFLAYALVANDALLGGITVGSLVISFQAFQRAQGSFGEILSQVGSLYEDNLFLQNYHTFMGLQPQIVAPANPVPVPQVLQQGIRFENVSFKYSNSDKWVLENLTFEIKAGETVALVGENGAGKTTLVKLLCRLYEPVEGRITLDGTDLREFDPAQLRRVIGVIFQDFIPYQMTARENIWMGDVESPPDADRIEAAARKSEAHAVIETLPQGYDTMLGEMFEGGRQLSIGQWQKVALGRAFLRDSQVMILDEPTSALDVMTEAAVFEHFRQITQGKTAVLISHRLSTVRIADHIFVLDSGRIAESGSHDTLMAQEGIYAHLFRTQAQNYLLSETTKS